MPNGIGSRIKTGSCQTGQLPGRIKSELCDLSGLRIDLISRLLSLSRLYSGILQRERERERESERESEREGGRYQTLQTHISELQTSYPPTLRQHNLNPKP